MMTFHTITYGVYGGLAGGVIFGAMMGMMGMLSMIGSMVGSPSPWVGFVVHMMISAVIGAIFSIVLALAHWRGTVGTGLAYGIVWWVLGPLTLMPAMMGMGVGANWNSAAIAGALPSLLGHLVFGAILGATVHWLETAHSDVGSHHPKAA